VPSKSEISPSDRSITLSPVYLAAASHLGGERGLSIRFPRFMKLREDKSWEQATSSAQFAEMYRKQIKEAPARAPPAIREIESGAPSSDPIYEEDLDDDED